HPARRQRGASPTSPPRAGAARADGGRGRARPGHARWGGRNRVATLPLARAPLARPARERPAATGSGTHVLHLGPGLAAVAGPVLAALGQRPPRAGPA